jgi:tellurite resistance protein TerC
MIPAVIEGPGPVAALGAIVIVLLLVDLFLFPEDASFSTAIKWSIGWFLLSLGAAIPIALLDGGEPAVNFTTVYLIERTLSLDNLFVFLVLFATLGVAERDRPKLLFYGIVLALIMRGIAILVGVELIERFDFVTYLLGALLVLLAVRLARGQDEEPADNRTIRTMRRLGASTGLIALVAIAVADVAFAVDSIPAAFAITTDEFTIWTANALALLGLRSLFVLVAELIKRFRYMDQTLAVVLGLVGIKLLLADVVHVSAPASLGIVLAAFAIGIALSLRAEPKPDAPGPPAL